MLSAPWGSDLLAAVLRIHARPHVELLAEGTFTTYMAGDAWHRYVSQVLLQFGPLMHVIQDISRKLQDKQLFGIAKTTELRLCL